MGNRTRQTGQSNDCSVDLRLSGPKNVKYKLIQSNIGIVNAGWMNSEPFSDDQFDKY